MIVIDGPLQCAGLQSQNDTKMSLAKVMTEHGCFIMCSR